LFQAVGSPALPAAPSQSAMPLPYLTFEVAQLVVYVHPTLQPVIQKVKTTVMGTEIRKMVNNETFMDVYEAATLP
jgi:hypothetical protein